MAKNRECSRCGGKLTDEDVMKIKNKDGSWETIPLTICPNCFKEQMRELAYAAKREEKEP